MNDKKWTPGRVVWRECLTTDVDKAKGFYGELFGWKFQDFPMGETTYWIVMQGERGFGGLMKTPDGVPACFMSYVSVPNVDEVAKTVAAEGGKVMMGPMDIPDVGRIAAFSDGVGAHLCVLHAEKGDEPTPERPTVGSFCWETLSSTDVEASKAFYGKLFGWKTQPAPGGHGAVFLADGDVMVGDVQKAENVPPNWMTYVFVENLDATKTRIEKLGGKVLMSKIEVQGMGLVAVLQDPMGAVFGIFQPT